MEPLQMEEGQVRTDSLSFSARVLLILFPLLPAPGCVSTGSLVPWGGEKPPCGTVCQIVATWHKEIAYAPDPTCGGAPAPGLAGRIYLFGEQISYPLVGDGSLVVTLFDDAPTFEGKAPVMLEEWRIDKETLRRLARKDMVGWGYTLFLPWGSYRPDVYQVHFRVRYDPPKGAPIYQESATVCLVGQKSTMPEPQTAARPTKPRG